MKLQANRAGANLLSQRLGARAVALAEEAEVERKPFDRFVHPAEVPRPRRAGGGVGAGRRPGAAANERRDARVERIGNLIRRDEVNVRIDAARRQDPALAGEHFGRCADLETRRHAVHDARSCRPCRSPQMRPSRMPTSAL